MEIKLHTINYLAQQMNEPISEAYALCAALGHDVDETRAAEITSPNRRRLFAELEGSLMRCGDVLTAARDDTRRILVKSNENKAIRRNSGLGGTKLA